MDDWGSLDTLQGPMEEIGLGHAANGGRFCGSCYARLGADLPARPPGPHPRPPSQAWARGDRGKGERGRATKRKIDDAGGRGADDREMVVNCPVCGRSTAGVAPVESVPAEVLALYLAKRTREGLWVNSFAFLGIFLSMVLSGILWFVLPQGWFDILAFAMLVFGSYYLARLLGFGIGATLGANSGRALRDRRWALFLAQRDAAAPAAMAIPPEPPTPASARQRRQK